MRTRLFFVALCIVAFIFIQKSAAQSWSWARATDFPGPRTSDSYANVIANDSHGNTYSAMTIESDSARFGGYSLISPNLSDTTFIWGALAKYDSGGTVLWTRNLGGENFMGGYIVKAITVDKADNVYVTGTFNASTFSIGSTTLHNVMPINVSNYFVAKFDPSGNLIWAQNNGPTWDGMAIKTDEQCNVYLAGDFSDTIRFGTDTLIDHLYGDDILLVKLDSAGNYQWSRSAGGNYTDRAQTISLDNQKNIYISGYFGSADFVFAGDTMHLSMMPSGYYDTYILKYDSMGTPKWIRELMTHDLMSCSLTNDSSGNLYAMGTFGVSSLALGSYTLHPIGSLDPFYAKYNGNGDVIWARSGGGYDLDYGGGIITDAAGQIWISGGTRSSVITFDTTHLACDISTNGSAFLGELDTSGNIHFLTGFRDGGYNLGNSISGDPFGNIFMAGSYFNGNCVIGSDHLPSTDSFGSPVGIAMDVYTAKLGYERVHPTPLKTGFVNQGAGPAIYPNPSPGDLTIFYPGPADATADATLYNVTGQQVTHYELATNTTAIHGMQVPPGLYICRITANGTSYTRKLIIR